MTSEMGVRECIHRLRQFEVQPPGGLLRAEWLGGRGGAGLSLFLPRVCSGAKLTRADAKNAVPAAAPARRSSRRQLGLG